MPELPPQLLNSLSRLDHFDVQAFIDAHEKEERQTSVRINPFKPREPEFRADKPVMWCEGGFYLEQRPLFTLDPLFHAGAYYVQEPGSMFLDFALRRHMQEFPNPRVLDLCAAPGGKSTLLNSLIGESGLLVANEIVKNRVLPLMQNLSRWGTLNTAVTNNDPSAFSTVEGYFDVMVVDAPCSGSGLFRKQPEAIDEWSERNVQMCAHRQKKILEDALPALREGGLLFYSTCSYSEEENEQIVQWLRAHHQMTLVQPDVPPEWGIVKTEDGFRFYPHKTRSEGFFCALLRKEKQNTGGSRQKKPTAVLPLNHAQKQLVSGFIDPEKAHTVQVNGRPYAMASGVVEFLSEAGGNFYLRKAGQLTGEVKGKDLVPSQDLAWSVYVREEVPRIELPYPEALLYLKKQGFTSENASTGLKLITHNGLGLGWAKILSGRINNYLPNELRILMQ